MMDFGISFGVGTKVEQEVNWEVILTHMHLSRGKKNLPILDIHSMETANLVKYHQKRPLEVPHHTTMNQVLTNRSVLRKLAIFLLSSFIFIGLDFQASKYANGLLFKQKEIALQIKLERINGVWFTYEGGLSLLADGEIFRHKDGTIVHVDRIHKYSTFKNGVAIMFSDRNKNEKTFYFSDFNQVIDRNPSNTLQNTGVELKWVNVLAPPQIFYYWRVVAVLIIIGILLQILFVLKEFFQRSKKSR